MASLAEAQAFLDQFDKCLPLCERGDAVTVINALHTLNSITQASISQAKELDPSNGRDFFCSFLLELELALELFISPSRKLGTIEGGLPALYSFDEAEIASLSAQPSVSTKEKVRKFLTALGVSPSSDFEMRGVAEVVKEFLRCQVKKSAAVSTDTHAEGRAVIASTVSPVTPVIGITKPISISWADQCSGSESDLEDMPALEDGDDFSDDSKLDLQHSIGSSSSQNIAAPTLVVEEGALDDDDEEEEDDCYPPQDEAAFTFLFAPPIHRHGDDDNEIGFCKPLIEEGYGIFGKYRGAGRQDNFFKTRMCKNWEHNGFCQFSARCNFAHGPEELRSADAAIQSWVSGQANKASARRQTDGGDEPDRASSLYKTRMCSNFEQTGVCRFGDKCSFAHGKGELRRGGGGGPSGPGAARGGFKKKLCERFSLGSCAFGAACMFAHGTQDLK